MFTNFPLHADEFARSAAEDGLRRGFWAERAIRELAERVDQQAAVISALGQILKDRLGLTDIELLAAVTRATDAQLEGQPRACSNCGTAVGSRKTRCIICGLEQPPKQLDDIL